MTRTLSHETWGDHTALIARSQQASNNLGVVALQSCELASSDNPLQLQYGDSLNHLCVAYETYGELNATGDNAILLCHALTGSAHAAGQYEDESVPGWWDPLIGPNKPIDTNKYFVVCSNVFGGCYGTSGPRSTNPDTGKLYRLDFPRYTIRDMVDVQKRLMEKLAITRWASVVGGSMGGMQVMEWAAMYPDLVGSVIPIGIGPRHSAWAIGLNEVARRAITTDPSWNGGNYPEGQQPENGLGLARAIAMLSYRSLDSLDAKFGRERVNETRDLLSTSFQIESYLDYQGVKLTQRFDSNTYIYITKAMDDYDICEGRGRLHQVLGEMTMPALCIGINSDVLYFESEVKLLAEHLPNSQYYTLNSPHGHDAFLIEFPQLAVRLRHFLQSLN